MLISNCYESRFATASSNQLSLNFCQKVNVFINTLYQNENICTLEVLCALDAVKNVGHERTDGQTCVFYEKDGGSDS